MAASARLAQDQTQSHQQQASAASSRSNVWRSVLPPLPSLPQQLSRAPLALPGDHASAAAAAPLDLFTSSRRRQPSPLSRTRALPLESDFGLPDERLYGSPDDFYPVTPALDAAALDDQFLSILAGAEFSSPSSYPSFLNPPGAADPPPAQATSPPLHQRAAAPRPGFVLPRRLSPCARALAGPSRAATHLTLSSARVSQNTLFSNGLSDEPLSVDSTQTSFSDMAPPTQQDAPNAQPQPPAAKKRRMSGPQGRNGKPEPLALPKPSDGDPFGGDKGPDEDDDLATIDLTKANEVPEELMKPKVDNRVKLANFQCAICMDDAKSLTVTHCGHLFCQLCLHSSLHVEATRGKCPMCRSKIDMKPRILYTSKTKGYWPLELKIMTVNKKGKRKADSM